MLDDPLSGPEMPPDVRIVYGKQSLGRWNEVKKDEDDGLAQDLFVIANSGYKSSYSFIYANVQQLTKFGKSKFCRSGIINLRSLFVSGW